MYATISYNHRANKRKWFVLKWTSNMRWISVHALSGIISCGMRNHKKKWRNLNNYHVIIFYLIYVDHLIENIFRTVSFVTFRTIECCSLFWVTSDSMRWIFSTGIWCREKHLFPKIPFFARHSKKLEIFGNKCF